MNYGNWVTVAEVDKTRRGQWLSAESSVEDSKHHGSADTSSNFIPSVCKAWVWWVPSCEWTECEHLFYPRNRPCL
eukprot:1298450-Amphidinium_carterae.1